MRTTITLDDDVAIKVRERVKASGKSAKTVYNNLLRSALLKPKQSGKKGKFCLPVFQGKPGLRPGFSWDLTTAEILDQLDEMAVEK